MGFVGMAWGMSGAGREQVRDWLQVFKNWKWRISGGVWWRIHAVDKSCS